MDFSSIKPGSLSPAEVGALDTESMLCYVQMSRANNFENELRKQIDGMKEKNSKVTENNNQIATTKEEIGNYRQQIDKLNSSIFNSVTYDKKKVLTEAHISSADIPGGSTSRHIPVELGNQIMAYQQSENTAGCYVGYPVVATIDESKNVVTCMQVPVDAIKAFAAALDQHINNDKTVASLNNDISISESKIKGLQDESDAASNSQQLDMLKLQETMSKLNQAMDMVSNMMKKFADSRSSIIQSIR